MVPKEIDSLYLDGESASGLIETLQSYIELYGDSLRIEEREYPYNGGSYMAIVADVLETDMEYAKRVAQEVENEARAEARERSQYEALKKKYG
jgi:hypothetical protein